MSVSPTPSTADTVTDEQQQRPSPSPLAKNKWKAVQRKVHTYHSVTHVVQHRAQEKIGFGVVNVLLIRLSEALASHITVPVPIVEHGSRPTKVVNGMRRWLAGIRRRLSRSSKASAMSRASEHGAHAAHHAAASSPLNRVLFTLHVLMPLLGTYLLSHMAHEGVHRAQQEWRKRNTRLTTALFCLGAFCDALDAAAHALIILCMIVDDGVLNHHLEHELHSYSLYVALVACIAMMLGEGLAAGRDNNDHHAHAHRPSLRHAIAHGAGHAAAGAGMLSKPKKE